MLTIRLNKAHYPVTVLGPGRRIGLWVQGCSLRCRGCISRDTWNDDPGTELPIGDVVGWCREKAASGVDGITISGGEPFDQPSALAALTEALTSWRNELDGDVDLLVYSGRTLAALRRRCPEALAHIDAIACGPYLKNRPSAHPWLGSDNQQIIGLTELGRRRYASPAPSPERHQMQMAVDQNGVWFIGVPGPGDMERLEAAVARRGVQLEGVSWRP